MTNSRRFDIQYTNKFKKQYSKIKKKQNFRQEELEKVIEILSNNEVLPKKYCNHLLNPRSERSMGVPCATRYTIRI